jgi:predicted CoA-binding protein
MRSCRFEMNEPTAIAEILRTARTIAVVGLTTRTWRPAYGVAGYLLRVGYTVVPVGPCDEVLGQKGYPDLRSVPVPIDLVDIFRRSDRVRPHVEEAIEVGARAVWLQVGIRDPEAESLAESAGLIVVADRCAMVEHARLAASGALRSAA